MKKYQALTEFLDLIEVPLSRFQRAMADFWEQAVGQMRRTIEAIMRPRRRSVLGMMSWNLARDTKAAFPLKVPGDVTEEEPPRSVRIRGGYRREAASLGTRKRRARLRSQ